MNLKALIVDYAGVLTDPGEDRSRPCGPSPIAAAVERARAAGVRTALLSNGDACPDEPALRDLFDAIVLSGHVGLAKPDPAVYVLTASRLGVGVSECVFVDDLPANVAGAVDVGMVGVRHTDVDSTRQELGILLGLDELFR